MRRLNVYWMGLVVWIVLAPLQGEGATVGVNNYTAPGFIIDSDPNRDFINVAGSYKVAGSIPGLQLNLRIDFTLVDQNGQGVLLEDGQGKSVAAISVDDSFTVASINDLRQVAGVLRLAGRLVPGNQYTVKLAVFRQSDGQSFDNQTASGQARSYVHFRDDQFISNPVNVALVVNSVVFSRTHLVTNIQSRDSFIVTPLATIYRYDISAGENHEDPVAVRYQVRLLNAVTSAEIPLRNNVFDFVADVRSTIGSGPETQLFGGQGLELRPLNPLPTVTQAYRVELTILHEEIAYLTDDVAITADANLMHLNGDLFFGTVRTRFGDLNNNPVVSTVEADHVTSTLNIPAGQGAFPFLADHTYGGVLAVRVYADGHAEYAGPAAINVSANGSASTVFGVSFDRSQMTLDQDGFNGGTVTVKLPDGFGYAQAESDMVLENSISFSNLSLNGSGTPTGGRLSHGQQVWVMEESKPFRIRVNGIDWLPFTGRFEMKASGDTKFVRFAPLTALEAELNISPLAAANRPSNDHLFRNIQMQNGDDITIVADAQGRARISAAVTLHQTVFRPHFPYHALNAPIDFDGGTAVVTNDLFDPLQSVIIGIDSVQVDYERGCLPEPGAPAFCNTRGDTSFLKIIPTGGALRITRDGGLQGSASYAAGQSSLRWGKRAPNEYAHRHATLPDKVSYLMAGQALPIGPAGNESLAVAFNGDLGPGVLLLSGMLPEGEASDKSERPGTVEYVTGAADYAGINLLVGVNGDVLNISILGNSQTPVFGLAGRSKYYIRPAGVSGIHEAEAGTRFVDFAIYGYNFQIDNFSLGMLDNVNPPGFSRLNGSMAVQHPANMTFQFGNMPITCSGQLTEPGIIGNNRYLLGQGYWNADLLVRSLRFEPGNALECNGERILTLNAESILALNPKVRPAGTIGLKNNGQIVRQSDGLVENLTSRLKLPANFRMPGPGNEQYNFTPLNDAYFNHQANHTETNAGFLSLPGEWQLPFFQSMPVLVHSDAQTNNPFFAYQVMDGADYRDAPVHDAANKGFEGNDLASHRRTDLPTAQQGWLGIDSLFSYPVKWNESGRSFTSDSDKVNLFLLNIDNRVKYLSPRHAELTFGVEYGNLPRLNLAGMAYDAVDRGVGFSSNMAHALGAGAGDVITGGLDKLAGAVSDRADFLEQTIAAASEQAITDLCHQLSLLDTNADGTIDLVGQIPATISGRLSINNNEAVGGRLRALLTDTDVNNINGLLGNVDDRLTAATDAVGQIRGLLNPNGETAGRLIRSLVADHAPDFVAIVAGALGQSATATLIGPELQEVDRQIGLVLNRFEEVRETLTDNADGLAAEISDHMVAAGTAELNGIMQDIAGDVDRFLARVDYDLGELGPDELKAYIRQRIRDRFYASAIVETIQHRMRQSVHDLQRAAVASLDSVIRQINEEIRKIIAVHLAEIDDEVNGIIGKLSDKIGSGRLRGYAHIEGDALRELALDGKFRLSVPDDMGFDAGLRIKQLQSDGKGSCDGADGVVINEIELEARNIAINWGGGEMRASIGTTFWIEDRKPIGMGGYFTLEPGGTPKFGTVELTQLEAAMGFAAGSNFKQAYFAGAAGMQFDEVALSGGAFFGSTCVLEPILIIDPDVGELLGTPPFTGAYVYGQGRIPIVNYGCGFRVSAGVGSGFFYFAEGPTYGGKLFGEIKGEALCAVTVKGDMTLIGIKQGDNFRFRGRGRVGGKVGSCPFCLKFRKSITVTYENGWDVDY